LSLQEQSKPLSTSSSPHYYFPPFLQKLTGSCADLSVLLPFAPVPVIPLLSPHVTPSPRPPSAARYGAAAHSVVLAWSPPPFIPAHSAIPVFPQSFSPRFAPNVVSVFLGREKPRSSLILNSSALTPVRRSSLLPRLPLSIFLIHEVAF